jgi:hypothetical protein
MILRLSLLIVSLMLLWSCRNEDFAKAEKNQQRNNQDFFKHTKNNDTFARAGVDYIDILDAYNKEKDFLAQMPDQQGMPIWEKMQIVDAEGATGLTVPLSYDGETLSSLLFVILDSKNSVTGTNNITNTRLEAIIYNADYSMSLREKLMNNFISMDYEVFGNTLFGNIPEDLYVGHKIEDSNRLAYGGNRGDYTGTLVQDDDSKMMVIDATTCTTLYHCTHHGKGACDYCSKCATTTCTTNSIPIFINEGTDFPTGNDTPGTGGGGTGTGTGEGPTNPGPGQPKDPCALKTVFYRLMPGCGGSGYPDLPELDDPCEKLKSNLEKAKILIEQNDVASKNNAMKANILTDTFEKAFYWGKDASGFVKTSNVVDGTNTNVNLSISNSQFTPEAYIHDHPGTDGYTNFSKKDINQFYDFHQGYNTITQNYVNASDGSLYVMTLEDQANFNAFITQYPLSIIDSNNDWKEGLDIRDDEDNILQYFIKQGKMADEAMDLTMGYIINKYNMGIMISKKGSDGKFHPIQVEKVESTDPLTGGTVVSYQKTNPCNL